MAIFVCFLFSLLMTTSYGINSSNGKGLEVEMSTLESSLLNKSIQNDNYVTTEKSSISSTRLQKKAPYFTNRKKMVKMHVRPAGVAIHLKCKAGGHPTPNITWYKNNKVPTRSSGNIEYDQWSLILENLSIDDSGNYRCVVCNALGCINYNYTVDVVERFPSRPYIKDGYPENITAMENSVAILECPQAADDLEPFIQWIKPRNYSLNFIKDDDIHDGTVLETSATLENAERLVLNNVTRESEGWYICVAANSLGKTSKSAYLSVINALEEEETTQFKMWLFIILGVTSAIVILTTIAIIFVLRKLKQKKKKKEFLPVKTAETAVVVQQEAAAEKL